MVEEIRKAEDKNKEKSNIYLLLFDAEQTYGLFESSVAHEDLARAVFDWNTRCLSVGESSRAGMHLRTPRRCGNQPNQANKCRPRLLSTPSTGMENKEKGREERTCAHRGGEYLRLWLEWGGGCLSDGGPLL